MASEVRALAEQSADAAREVKDLVLASSAQAGRGLALAARAGEALHHFETGVQEIDGIASSLASNVLEQATGLAKIDSAASHMDQLTQQSAALAEEAHAASRSLANESGRLASLIEQVRFEDRAQVALGLKGERCPERRDCLYEPLRSRGASRLP